MAFDKAAYWAQKGQPRPKGRKCVILQCGTCGSSDGTVKGKFFVCNTHACQKKLAKSLFDHMMAAAAAEEGKLPEHMRPGVAPAPA